MFTVPRLTSSMALAGQTLCVLLVFFPFMLLGFFSGWRYESASTAERMLSLANALTARQTTLTASTQVLLTTLSLAPVVRHGSNTELLSFLQQLDLNQPDYAGFAVFGTDGGTVASVSNGKPRESLSAEIIRGREYFQLAMEQGTFSIGGALQLPEQHIVLPMSMPVRGQDSSINGLVMAPLQMNVLDRVVQAILKGSQDRVLMFDRNKQLVYSYPDNRAEIGTHVSTPLSSENSKKAGSSVYTTISKMVHMGSYPNLEKVLRLEAVKRSLVFSSNTIPQPTTDGEYVFEWTENSTSFVGAVQALRSSPHTQPYMYIATATEQLTLKQFLQERYWLQFLGMLATFLLALFLSRFIGRAYFSNGLEKLAKVATQNQHGDVTIRNGDVPGCQEIGILASAFDSMLAVQEANTKALKNLSNVDPLTGLWNRRKFTEIALAELGRAERYHHGLAVVMADIDKFKNVNDTYGHAAGDEVLRVFASLLQKSIRDTDVVARFGGEEFIFLLPEATEVTALAAMEKVRQACASLTVSYEHQAIRFTSSFGISVLKPHMVSDNGELDLLNGTSPLPKLTEVEQNASSISQVDNTLLPNDKNTHDDTTNEAALQVVLTTHVQQADAALYRSKEEGRNRVTLWSPAL